MANNNIGIGSFILGGLIGAATGLLFAPRTGVETREFLADKVLEYWDNADEYYGAGRDKAIELYSSSRDVALDATDQVRTKIDAARARLLAEVGPDLGDDIAPEAESAQSIQAAAAEKAPKEEVVAEEAPQVISIPQPS